MKFLDKRIFTHFDFFLIVLILPLIFFSWSLIGEISTYLANKQLAYNLIGLGVFIFVFLLPIRQFKWIIPVFYWISILLLLAVFFFGVSKLGAQRWLLIPIVNLTIQPSELVKPAFILMLAYLIDKNPPEFGGYG